MSGWTILLPIVIPAVAGALTFLIPKNARAAQNALAIAASLASLVMCAVLFRQNLTFETAWAGFGMDFSLRLYNFSAFILLAASAFTFLIVVYSAVFMKGKPYPRQFFGFLLLTSAFVTGAALADNLVLMIFFWEGLLALLFPLILTGGNKATKTAVKALILSGVADLCLILGAGILAWQAGTMAMDKISLPLNTFWVGFAFIMMMIGAAGKAGALPFHSWIPDAADDAPLPVMAILPGALEKMLGIYLLTRITMDFFQIQPGSGFSITMMIVGSCTIIFAVLMALIQKDYKRLLSYHAISQVGYMILGVGTALPIGIIGGLFHMINNAMYKSCLFLTAGAVEKETGTTDIRQLGGLAKKMPVTAVCFVVAALSISGVPPFNGFFSKELIFDAASQINVVFLIIAIVGAFFTAASFLKLGHAVYFGKPSEALQKAKTPVKEAPWPMLAPMIIIAAGCVLFGVYNPLPVRGILSPILGNRLTETISGLPQNWWLAAVSVVVLCLAALNHWYGVRKSGKPSGASDHIHYAPVMHTVYGWAEAKLTDPYEIGMKLVNGLSIGLFAIDRAIDWVDAKLTAIVAMFVSSVIRKAHTGQHWMYVLWTIAGAAVVAIIFVGVGR